MKWVVFVFFPCFSFGQVWSGDTDGYWFNDRTINLAAPTSGQFTIQDDLGNVEYPIVCEFQANLNFNPSNNNQFAFGFTNEENEEIVFEIGENGSNDGLNALFKQNIFLKGCLSESPSFDVYLVLDDQELRIQFATAENVCRLDTTFELHSFNSRATNFFFKSKITSSNTENIEITNYQSGRFTEDTLAPRLIRSHCSFSPNQFTLFFSEDVFAFSPLEENLEYLEYEFENSKIKLSNTNGVSSIKFTVTDRFGNSDTISVSLDCKSLEYHDILVSEILLDPFPALTDGIQEFIELTNRTDDTIRINELTLKMGDDKIVLKDFYINPYDTYCISDTSYGANFPPLSNSGEKIVCKLGDQIVDFWDLGIPKGNYKSDGGWSIERVFNSECALGQGVWSTGPYGHTAGVYNPSFGFVRDSLRLESVSIEEGDSLRFNFSLGLAGIRNAEFRWNDSIIQLDGINRLLVNAPTDFEQASIKVIGDYCGVDLNQRFNLNVGPILPLQSFKFEINELLTLSDDNDFIEFRILGDGCFLSDSLLIGINKNNNESERYFKLPKNKVICSGSYLTVTGNSSSLDLLSSINSNDLLKVDGAFNLPSDHFTLKVLTRRLKLLNQFDYHEDMHNEAFSDLMNISLSNHRGDWFSDEDLGTPTNKNTMPASARMALKSADVFRLHSEDQLSHRIAVEWSGQGRINVSLFTREGIELKKISNNLPFYNHQTFDWDGRVNNQKVPKGIYVLLVQLRKADGQKVTKKKVLTII